MTGQHWMYKDCEITTYAEAVEWFARARNPAKGRPYGRWAKVFKVEGGFEVEVYGVRICRITPDNTLTMLVNGGTGSKVSNTLSMSIYRLIPIGWHRAGMRRYRIPSLKLFGPADQYWHKAKEAPEVFIGLQLDLNTGKFINPKPDMLDRVVSDRRKEWLKALRTYKQHLKLRVKMGVFDAVQQELNKADGPKYVSVGGKIFANRAPDWTDEKWMDLLYTSIRDNQHPKELIAGFLLNAPGILWTNKSRSLPVVDRMMYVVDTVIKANSVELRRRFGVFSNDDEVTNDG